MKVILDCESKEIADLVLALQDRQGLTLDDASISDAVKRLRETQGPTQQAYSL